MKRWESWRALGPRYCGCGMSFVVGDGVWWVGWWGSYAWEVAVLPQHGAADEEEVFEVAHGGDGVEEEAHEVWEGDVRDAVC